MQISRGVHAELLLRGANADLGAGTRRLSDGARARLDSYVVATYDQFLERVAAGRNLPVAEVDRVAQGRVWTGAQAHERGLVDELGGLREAAVLAKLALGLDAEADVELVTYPPPKSLPEQIAELMNARIAAAVRARMPLPAPLARLERMFTGLPAGQPLLVPPVLVEIR